ncbi:hypothetical protein [Paucilactobacillus sp. N302-9]
MKLIYNFFKNHFWFETGLEFLLIAYVFLGQQHGFDNRFSDLVSNVINHIDDQWVVIPIVMVATICISFAVWDVNGLFAKETMVFISQFTAVMMFMTFLWHSISFPHPSPDTKVAVIYSFIVVLRIFLYWVTPLVNYKSYKNKVKGGAKNARK